MSEVEDLKAALVTAQSRIADLELLNRTQLCGWEDESRRLRARIAELEAENASLRRDLEAARDAHLVYVATSDAGRLSEEVARLSQLVEAKGQIADMWQSEALRSREEIARLRLPAEVVEIIHDALAHEAWRNGECRGDATAALAALKTAYPEVGR